jgi:hypothetical protein
MDRRTLTGFFVSYGRKAFEFREAFVSNARYSFPCRTVFWRKAPGFLRFLFRWVEECGRATDVNRARDERSGYLRLRGRVNASGCAPDLRTQCGLPDADSVEPVRSSSCHFETWSRVAASQTLTVPSALPVTIRCPSGENLAENTQPLCPLKVSSSPPVVLSQSFAV